MEPERLQLQPKKVRLWLVTLFYVVFLQGLLRVQKHHQATLPHQVRTLRVGRGAKSGFWASLSPGLDYWAGRGSRIDFSIRTFYPPIMLSKLTRLHKCKKKYEFPARRDLES